jgi:large conductance mechanosensitive channel
VSHRFTSLRVGAQDSEARPPRWSPRTRGAPARRAALLAFAVAAAIRTALRHAPKRVSQEGAVMFSEFKAFIMRGNVLDLAVAVIIGGAFGKIVTSLVNDLIMPPIGLLLGNVDFSNLFVSLSGVEYTSLAEAQKAGAATLNYGMFINAVVSFLIVAFTIFVVVRAANRLQALKPKAEATPTTRDCPHCLSTIPLKATRCAHCTQALQPA